MPRHFFHTALFSSVAAMLAMLATTAHSTAIVRARVDPPAGFGIPGFDGYADFESALSLSPACLGDGWKAVNTSGGCGSVAMYDSVIYLYGSGAGQGPGNSAHQDTMQFVSELPTLITILALGDPDAIFGIYLQSGEIAGIDMNLVFPYSGPSSGYEGRDFQLTFGTNCAFTTGTCLGFNPTASLRDDDTGSVLPGRFTVTETDLEESEPGGTNTGPNPFPGPTAVIPEPGTLSLLLAALGGAWLARRRSKLTQ